MTSLSFGYSAIAEYPDHEIVFEEATEEDIPELAALYKKIAITRENYDEKFNSDSENSFSKSGGMYIVHTEETLKEVFDEGKSFFAVARKDGKIAGSFWVCEYDPHFTDFRPDIRYFADASYYESLIKAIKENTVIYPRELIVDSDVNSPKVSLLLFYTIFECMKQRGYTHSLGEVYRLHSVIKDGKETVLEMLNDRSFNMTASTGGFHLGKSPLFEANCDGFTAVIEAQIFDFDYQYILPLLSRLFSLCNIKISFPVK